MSYWPSDMAVVSYGVSPVYEPYTPEASPFTFTEIDMKDTLKDDLIADLLARVQKLEERVEDLESEACCCDE